MTAAGACALETHALVAWQPYWVTNTTTTRNSVCIGQ